MRREWLASFAGRKTPPKGVEGVGLTCLLAGDHEIRMSMENRHPLLRASLSLPEAEGRTWERGYEEIAALIEQMASTTKRRLGALAALLLLMAWKERTSTQTWRSATPQVRSYPGATIERATTPGRWSAASSMK